MSTQTEKQLSTGAKVFICATVIIAFVNAIDFVFYGSEVRNLLGAIGFGLMAYGISRNGIRFDQPADPGYVNHPARYAAKAGVLLALASFLFKWFI